MRRSWRSVATQYQKFQAATYSFKDKYFALPGDMTNAQSFWGVAHATPATCITTASTTSATCNGNGDGLVNYSAGSNEWYRFWQHLANAGLIEGQYSGVSAALAPTYVSTASNSPAAKLSSSLWFVVSWGIISDGTGGGASVFNGTYNNTFQLGGIVAGGDPAGYIFTPEELWNIDTKLDDGKPATGKLRSRSGLSSGCTNAASYADLTGSYLLSFKSVACAALFTSARII